MEMDEARIREIVREEIAAVRLERIRAVPPGFDRARVSGLIEQIDQAVRDGAHLDVVSFARQDEDRALSDKVKIVFKKLQSLFGSFRVKVLNCFGV
jgi:hypothetical protein